MTADQSTCFTDGVVDVTNSSGGLLASVVTRQRGVGGHRCPWRVDVEHGRVVQVALLHDRHQEVDAGAGAGSQRELGSCAEVARIFENGQVRVLSKHFGFCRGDSTGYLLLL